MNKKFSLIMLFMLFFSCLSIFNSKDILASSSSLDDKPYFSLEGTDTIVIDRRNLFSAGETQLIIPSTYQGRKITKVKSTPYASSSNPGSYSIQKIIIQEGITEILPETFYSSHDRNSVCYFANVTEVVLPKSLTYIGNSSFKYMDNLKKINLEDTSVEDISDFAFDHCVKLSEFKLPKTLKNIGTQTFLNVPLTKIYVPKSIMSIGSWAFGNNEPQKYPRNFTEIFIDTDGETMPRMNEAFDLLRHDKNVKVYINYPMPNDKNTLKQYISPSIDPNSNKSAYNKFPADRVFLKNKQGEWENLYNNSPAPPEELPTLEPSVIPSISANGQTIINIGISKEEKAPDRLSVTVPTDLAILVHAPNNEANPVDVYIGGGNKGQGQANSSINFLNSSHTSDLTPTSVEIKSATITSLGSGWQLQNFESPLTANQIAMQVNNSTNLTIGTNILNITLNNAHITTGEISPIQTSVPISVKIGGNCSDYQTGKATAPVFNINWRIGKKTA